MTDANIQAVAATRGGQLAPVACLLVVGALLGVTTNLAKLATDAGAPPLGFLFWSMTGSGLALAGVAWALGQRPPLTRRTTEYFLVSGLLFAGPNALLFSAVPHVGAGFAALSISFPPLYTYAMALAGRMERPQLWRAVGVGLGVLGAVTLAWSKSTEPDAELGWILATLSAPVVIALGNIYRTLRWPNGVSAVALAPGMLLAAAGLMLVGAGVFGYPIVLPLEGGPVAGLLAAETLTFAVMYALYFLLQRLAGPVYLSQIGSVGAVFGAGVAFLALGEAPPSAIAPAALLIAAGAVLVARSKSR